MQQINKGLTGLGGIEFPEITQGLAQGLEMQPSNPMSQPKTAPGIATGAGVGAGPQSPAQDSIWSKLANILLDKYLSMNSSRGAIWEQEKIDKLFPDPNALFTQEDQNNV